MTRNETEQNERNGTKIGKGSRGKGDKVEGVVREGPLTGAQEGGQTNPSVARSARVRDIDSRLPLPPTLYYLYSRVHAIVMVVVVVSRVASLPFTQTAARCTSQ